MPTANYDASRVTQRNRSVAMATWNAANNIALNARTTVRREQPSGQLNELLAYRDMSSAFYTPVVNGVAGCDCSQDVVVNAGGR